MSRAVASCLLVLAGGAAATGGVLLSGEGSSGRGIKLPDGMGDFAVNGEGLECVGNMFGGLRDLTGREEATVENKGVNFFGRGGAKEGCVWARMDRGIVGSGTAPEHWTGELRLLLAIKGEDRGFVMVLMGKTPRNGTEKAVMWTGAVYDISRKNGVWAAGKAAGVDGSKKFVKGGEDETTKKKFPHPGMAMKISNTGQNSRTVGDFWALMSEVSDLEKICSEDQCRKQIKERQWLKGRWEWKAGGEKTNGILDWTKDVDTWWKEIFGEEKFSLKEACGNSSGVWTVKQYDTFPREEISEEED